MTGTARQAAPASAARTRRARLFFRCPACGHEAPYSLALVDGAQRNVYLCERCGALAQARTHAGRMFAGGIGVGAVAGIVTYGVWLSSSAFAASTLAALLVAMAVICLLTWAVMPSLSKLLFKWSLPDKPAVKRG